MKLIHVSFACALLALGGFVAPAIALAEMLHSDSIGNDPQKEKLCAERAHSGPVVPFEIDAQYLAMSRSNHGDATFVAVDGITTQLVECYLQPTTGTFQPISFSPEQWYWHPIRPPRYEPSVQTPKGAAQARSVCERAALEELPKKDFDHTAYTTAAVRAMTYTPTGAHSLSVVGRKKVERFDVIVEGLALYRSSGPDMTRVSFRCLLSPMLDLKSVEMSPKK